MSRRARIGLWIVGVIAVIGVVAAFVMFGPPRVADTLARPAFCASCHEMEPWYDGFQQATHAELGSCNDCHLPHDTVFHYYFWEGVVGVRDLVKHTVGAIPETMEATERSRRWIQDNCIRCHVPDDVAQDHGEDRDFCWDCHDDDSHEVEQE